MRKCVFLFNEWKLEKVIEFRGGHPSSIFSNSCSFLRYAFLRLKFIFQNIDFWEKSFYYSSFYTKKISFDPVLAHFWNSSAPPNAIHIGLFHKRYILSRWTFQTMLFKIISTTSFLDIPFLTLIWIKFGSTVSSVMTRTFSKA